MISIANFEIERMTNLPHLSYVNVQYKKSSPVPNSSLCMVLLHSRVFKLVSGNGLWFQSYTQFNKPMSLLPKPSFGMIPLPASAWLEANFVGLIFKICVKTQRKCFTYGA